MTRGRKPRLEPTRPLNVHISESVRAKLDLLLYSDVEQRVPHGAYQRFFERLILWTIESRELDLSPFVSALPGEHIVRGREETLRRLQAYLTAKQGS
jgi:hypothetical protein